MLDSIREYFGEANPDEPERWISIVAGSALAAYGLKRRSITGLVLAALGGGLVARGASGVCPVYHTLGINNREEHDRNVSVPYGTGVRVEKSVTINATPENLYAFWRNLENLPRFMSHLQSVRVIDEKSSHWVAKGPLGKDVEWDAEIINEVPGEMIAWRSVSESEVDNAGSVHFEQASGDRGSTVKVVLRYDPPGGKVGVTVAKMFRSDPAFEIGEDLRKLKQIIETGEMGRKAS